jgi:hypothetical protein
MFTSYNNEQNQRGGMNDKNVMSINAGKDLNPRRINLFNFTSVSFAVCC